MVDNVAHSNDELGKLVETAVGRNNYIYRGKRQYSKTHIEKVATVEDKTMQLNFHLPLVP